jgi:hypothetical protein
MLITFKTQIVIKNIPEAIYDFITDPANWTASNPEEQMGLKIFGEDCMPRTDAKFYQKKKYVNCMLIFVAIFFTLMRRKSLSGGV